MQTQSITHMSHLNKGFPLLPILVSNSRSTIRLAQLTHIQFNIIVRIPQNGFQIPPATLFSAPPPTHTGARRLLHTAQRRGHVVRIAVQGIGRHSVMIPIFFAFKFTVRRSFVHQRLRHDRSAHATNHVAIFAIQHKGRLVIVAARGTLFEFFNLQHGAAIGRGQVIVVFSHKILVVHVNALAQNDRVKNTFPNAGKFLGAQIGRQHVLNPERRRDQNILPHLGLQHIVPRDG
mmetsp:Transcript_19402/g.45355  ORF Transcript_19402/g.45355 Transcript_19402/m.45355 type:complete len:233 (-) Transcript_19402:1109-1807(-)